tara:strand:+ start:73 stop:330 length:258 start_codon:yes stop_codon:yes gene_type:complete
MVVTVGNINTPHQSSINNGMFLTSVVFIITIKIILVVNDNTDKVTDIRDKHCKIASVEEVIKAVVKPAIMALVIDITSKIFVNLA